MGHKWLDGKNWGDITRTERYFVWKLASAIEPNPLEFLRWINENTELRIGKHISGGQNPSNIEVATDVRLFNDYSKFANANPAMADHPGVDNSELDLVVFSPKLIIIFEAKAWGKFDGSQLDRERSYLGLIGEFTECEVKFVGIYSSRYSPTPETLSPLSAHISWRQISTYFEGNPSFSSIFLRANRCYENKRNDRKLGLTQGYDLSS